VFFFLILFNFFLSYYSRSLLFSLSHTLPFRCHLRQKKDLKGKMKNKNKSFSRRELASLFLFFWKMAVALFLGFTRTQEL